MLGHHEPRGRAAEALGRRRLKPTEARRVLGIGDDAGWDDIRDAFRRQVRAVHPDVSSGSDAGTRTAALTEAYAVLRDTWVEPAPPVPPTPPLPVEVSGEDITVGAPARETFLRLLDAAHDIGEVTYVDLEGGLLEVVIEIQDGPTCSLVATLQGRAPTGTEVFCTVEPLGAGPAPPAADVVRLLARRMAR